MAVIDIERIKQYNQKYRECQQKAVELRAQLSVNTNEINRLCKELSDELGQTVTVENLQEIYEQKVKEINSNLELGEGILKRIESDVAAAESGPVTPVAATAPTPAPATPVQTQQRTVTPPQMQVQAPQAASGAPTFGAMPSMNSGMPQMNTLRVTPPVTSGFDSIGGPEVDIPDGVPVEKPAVTPAPSNGAAKAFPGAGSKNPFMAAAAGKPVNLPQMFSRNGNDVPGYEYQGFDSI